MTSTGQTIVASEPRWVEIERPPYADQPLYCHACGAMIPRRYWDPGNGDPYCGPACRDLERRVEALTTRFPHATRPPVNRGS